MKSRKCLHRSPRKSKKTGGKKRFGRRPPPPPNPEAIKILDEFLEGKVTLAKAVTELQDIYCPSKLNLTYKKEILELLKKGELQKEEAERKLRFFFRLPHEFIPKNKPVNGNKKNNNALSLTE